MQVFNKFLREIHIDRLWKLQIHDELLVDDILCRCDLEVELLHKWLPHADVHIEEVQG